jgi:hypothetical protein
VQCLINLANRGAGLPDGGLFTPDQFQRASEADPLPGQLPSRGAIEIKGTGDDLRTIAASDQVIRYLSTLVRMLPIHVTHLKPVPCSRLSSYQRTGKGRAPLNGTAECLGGVRPS